jgi:hypothetical protein
MAKMLGGLIALRRCAQRENQIALATMNLKTMKSSCRIFGVYPLNFGSLVGLGEWPLYGMRISRTNVSKWPVSDRRLKPTR